MGGLVLFLCLPPFFSKNTCHAQEETSSGLALFESGQKEQKNLKWERSLAIFRQAISSYPKTRTAQKAHIEIGKFYKYQRDWQKAINEYHQAIAIDPHSRPSHDAKTAEAAVYYFRQDFPRALEIFKEVLSETKDWDQIKYCSYWIKELKRKMSFAPEESFSCGPESLKIVFNILGIEYSDKEIAKLFAYEKNNQVSISELAKVSAQKNLNPKIVKVSASDIENLSTPFIALVNPEHYIVVSEAKAGSVKFIDPANKKDSQTATLDKFSQDFKGYALIFLEDTKLAKANYTVPQESEQRELKGGVCWCCPPSALGGPGSNQNVEFDGAPPCGPGMPSWMVNTVNLNLIIQDIDFSYTSRGMPLEFIRTHNADDPREGIFGRSWTFNYSVSLVENPDGSIDIRRGDGRVDHFFYNGIRYQGPNGVYDTLIKNGDGTYSLKIKKDKTTQNFNAQGRLINIKDRNNNTISFSYDAEDKLIRITDPNNKNIDLAYGANKKVSRITLPDARFVSFIYDANNNLIQAIDLVGATVSFTYDAASYITAITTPHRGTTTIGYTIGSEGYAIQSITDALGNKRSYGTYQSHYQIRILDSRNNAVVYKNNYASYTESITIASGNKVSFEYDSFGNRTKIIDMDSNATSLTYDAKGNITSITDPLANKIILAYDANDNLTQTTDPKGNINNFSYDTKSNLLSVRDPDNQTTNFTYNTYGQLTRITDAKGGVTDFTYNILGNLTKMTNPLGKFTTYNYDTLGRLTSLTDPKAQTFSYTYDGVDHLTKITYPDATAANYTYNCCNLLQVQDKFGTLKFTYDALGRMMSFTNYDNKVISYNYDSEDNLVTLTYPDSKKVNYEYDADNRLIKVTDWLGNVTQYNYDSRGNLSFSISPGLITIYKYDEVSRLTKLINYNSNTMAITSGFEFTPDVLGNRTQIKRYQPLNLPTFNLANSSYSYNSDSQLISATGQSFAYDNNGNLLSRTNAGVTANLTYNYDNQLTQYTSGTTTLAYLYDALGNRIKKTSGSVVTKYIVDPNRTLPSVLAETNASGNITSYYVYGLGVISKIVGTTAYFYQYDGLGSTVAITDKTGAVVNKYAYDDFGNLATNSTETVANPFKYVGKFGVATDLPDLLYMRARYYSPSVGRFINKDPIGLAGGMNLYAYVGNNPLSWIDPGGLRQWAPDWIQRLILPYGNYGGPANTDPTFQKQPMDSQDEIFMGHDKGWANDQCSPANRSMFNDFVSLPINPYRWKRKPRNIFWTIYSIPYRMLATSYAFWF